MTANLARRLALAALLASCAWPAAAQTTITTSTTVSGSQTYSSLLVGGTSAPGPTLTITDNAGITITGSSTSGFTVGSLTNPFGSVVQQSGTVTSNSALYLGFNQSAANTTYSGSASYTLNGGSIILTGTEFGFIAIGRSSAGILTQNGGTITTGRGSSMNLGPAGDGAYVLTGGTFEALGDTNIGAASSGSIGQRGSNGTLTINGSGAVMALNGRNLEMAMNLDNSPTNKGSATVQLLNGTLAVNGDIARGRPAQQSPTVTNGPGTVSFTMGGGTLRPYNADLNVGITTSGSNNLPFDVTLAANSLSTITGIGWKSGSAHTVTLFSNLVGSGSVQFTGGTVTLSAANTYSGATTIAGTNATLRLSATGSFANSSTIRVGNAGSSNAVLDLTSKTSGFTFSSGQTVGGIGTINIGAGRTVASTGIWAPGNSIGSNAVTGNLTLSGTSQFELGTPGPSTSAPGLSDFTAVSGTLTLGGNLSLINNANADGLGSAAGGVYRLFTYGSAVTGSYASVTTNPSATTVTGLGNISYGGSGTSAGQGVFLTVYDRAVASFGSGPTALTTLTLDFLSVNQGDSVSPQNFSLYNLLQTAGFTADLALLSITPGLGNTDALSTNLSLFNSLASGTFNSWQATVNTSNQGTFTNTWTLSFKSSNANAVYSGDSTQTLTLTANVIVVPEPGAIALAGIGIAAAAYALRRRN